MPECTHEEIKKLIESNAIKAITLDTSVFDQFDCNLEYKTLAALDQFKGSDIQFILSPVVVGEVSLHISSEIRNSAEKARAGINQLLKATRSKADLDALLSVVGAKTDPIVRAKEMTEAYIAQTAAEIIPNAVLSDELLRRYFGSEPPFGSKGDKKAEFPDAIALLGLRDWAALNDTIVLMVSRDGDWKAFAKAEPQLVCIDNLNSALNLFHANEGVIANRIAGVIKGRESTRLISAIETRLDRFIEDFEIEASSAYYYDEEAGPAYITSWGLWPSAPVSVVDSGSDDITLGFVLDVEADFEAYFRFHARDGYDRDYVRIGSTRETRSLKFTVDVAATLSRDVDPEPIEIEVEGPSLVIDFGDVEPSR